MRSLIKIIYRRHLKVNRQFVKDIGMLGQLTRNAKKTSVTSMACLCFNVCTVGGRVGMSVLLLEISPRREFHIDN